MPRLNQVCGILGSSFLRALQFRDAFLGLARAQQGQAVVHVLAGRIRRQVQRFFELLDGLRLRGGVLIKGFAEIAEAPYAVLLDARRVGAGEQHKSRNREDDNADPGANSVHHDPNFQAFTSLCNMVQRPEPGRGAHSLYKMFTSPSH